MNDARKAVCDKCNGQVEYCLHHPWPISQDEYDYMGCSKNDKPNTETVRKLMEISMKPECMERMLKKHPIEWWTDRILKRNEELKNGL